MRTISRRATRIISGLKDTHTQCKKYDQDTGDMIDCDPAEAWEALTASKNARLYESTDRLLYTVHVHSNRFYRLTAFRTSDDTTPADDTTSAADTAPARAAATPAAALGRVLRDMGLRQGPNGDFRVQGFYVNGERRNTYAELLSPEARTFVADHADEIQKQTGNTPFPFTVAVHYIDGRPWPTVSNGRDHASQTPAPAADRPTVPFPVLGPDEDGSRSYALRAVHEILADAPHRGTRGGDRFPFVSPSTTTPNTVLVVHMHKGSCTQSEKRRREHAEDKTAWTELLEAAGCTVTMTIRCGLAVALPEIAPLRVHMMTTGLPGQTVTEVTFPDHGVGGTITQVTSHASMGYAAKSSTGRHVQVGRSDLDQAVQCLVHHWSLPTENLDIVREDDHPRRNTASAPVRTAPKANPMAVASIRDTFHHFAATLEQLATADRPEPGEGSADLAVNGRIGAALFAELRNALDVRASWLNDPEQVYAYLSQACQHARGAGFHVNAPEELAMRVKDFIDTPFA